MITQQDFIALLREQARPNQGAWAETHKIAASYLSDVLNGRRDPGKSILKALGYERVVLYRRANTPCCVLCTAELAPKAAYCDVCGAKVTSQEPPAHG